MNEENNTESKDFDAIVKLNATEQQLAALELKYKNVPDCSTEDGFKEAKKGKKELTSLRVKIDEGRKEKRRQVNVIGNAILARITALEDPYAAAIKKITDEAKRKKEEKLRIERERVEGIETKINGILSKPMPFSGWNPSGEILPMISKLENYEITKDGFQEFTDKAIEARKSALETLNEYLETSTKRETEEKAKKEQQELVAKEQAEQAAKFEKEKAEFEAKKAADKKERLRLQKIEDDKRVKEQSARDAADAAKEKERLRIQKIEDDKRAVERAKHEAEKAKWQADQKAAQEKLAAEQAEIDRQNQEKEEAERKEKEHLEQEWIEQENVELAEQRRIESLKSIQEILDGHVRHDDTNDALTLELFEAIKAGKIPHVKYTG